MRKRKRRHFGMQAVTATISTTLVLLLVGMVTFFVLAAHGLSGYVRENMSLTAEIDRGQSESDIFRLKAEMETKPFARSVQYISKEQARHEYVQAMGADPQKFLEYNPLPAMLEVKLNAAYANTDSLATVAEGLRADKRISRVEYQEDLMDVVNRNIRTVSIALVVLAAVLTLISFALISNTVRLAMHSQRFLIYTMKLVGASPAFIRRPFMRRNFVIGLAATVTADVLLWAAAYWAVGIEPQMSTVVTADTMLVVSGVVLAFGLTITMLCAYLSTNKYIGMKASDLYYI